MGKGARYILLKEVFRRPDFILASLAGAVGLATIYYWLLLRVSNLQATVANVSGQPLYASLFLILVLLTLVLFGLNFGLFFLLFRAGVTTPVSFSSFLGALLGGFGAACPVCGAFLLSLVGVTAGLAALPLAGIEIWTGSSVIMGFALFASFRALDRKTCDFQKAGGAFCWRLPALSRRTVLMLLLVTVGLLVNFNLMLATNEPSLRNETIAQDKGQESLYDEVRKKVLPDEGITLPIRWGNWLPKLVKAGIIDLEKFEESFAQSGGLTPDQKRLFAEESNEFITVNSKNSWFLVTVLWPLGLANKLEINNKSPILGKSLFNFASTGGWTLGRAKNGGEYFNKYEIIRLTPEQEKLVGELARSFYRPCCNNSTFFQDCNHGSALFGLLQLGASQGLSRPELARAALVVNSFWFPNNYLQVGLYLKAVRGIDWEGANPEEILSPQYSSATGNAEISREVAARGLLPKAASGPRCGV